MQRSTHYVNPVHDTGIHDGYHEHDHYDDAPADQPVAGGGDEVMKQTPWFAISIAFHAALLLLVWSLVISVIEEEPPKSMATTVDPPQLPVPPPIKPTIILPERPQEPVEQPTEDPRIVPDATQEKNMDPSEIDNQELRPNPNPSDSNADSEMPVDSSAFNSSIGMGGNLGGPGGLTGDGGPFHSRARGGPTGDRPNDDRTHAGLCWLADHQNEDGSWDPVHFAADGARNGRTEGSYGNPDGSADTGWEHSRSGLTGLALLAYLGAGYTHEEGEFAQTVKKALRYLRAVQDNDGCFDTTNREDPHYVYSHAICTMAMAEAYGMSGANMLKGPAQKGVDFIAMAQNQDPDLGPLGWRYGVKPGDNDASVTGWMALALKSARVVGLDVPHQCFDGAITFLDQMTGTFNGYPKTGYIQKAGSCSRLQSQAFYVPQPSMDSINVLTRMFVRDANDTRIDPAIRAQADRIIDPENLPTLEAPEKRDFYYWYYASLAMFQMGDRWWKKWEGPMAQAILGLQHTDGDRTHRLHGSWDPVCAWGPAGGRVYATAINVLTLEVYYRYGRQGGGK